MRSCISLVYLAFNLYQASSIWRYHYLQIFEFILSEHFLFHLNSTFRCYIFLWSNHRFIYQYCAICKMQIVGITASKSYSQSILYISYYYLTIAKWIAPWMGYLKINSRYLPKHGYFTLGIQISGVTRRLTVWRQSSSQRQSEHGQGGHNTSHSVRAWTGKT